MESKILSLRLDKSDKIRKKKKCDYTYYKYSQKLSIFILRNNLYYITKVYRV